MDMSYSSNFMLLGIKVFKQLVAVRQFGIAGPENVEPFCSLHEVIVVGNLLAVNGVGLRGAVEVMVVLAGYLSRRSGYSWCWLGVVGSGSGFGSGSGPPKDGYFYQLLDSTSL